MPTNESGKGRTQRVQSRGKKCQAMHGVSQIVWEVGYAGGKCRNGGMIRQEDLMPGDGAGDLCMLISGHVDTAVVEVPSPSTAH